jgi:C-terminal processing protease CtpA/Prc
MKSRRFKSGVIFAVLSAVVFTSPINAAPEQIAQAYLDQALELIRLHHRKASQSDWQVISANANSEIENAKVPQDTYPAIKHVLSVLNETHSFFVEPSAVPKGETGLVVERQNLKSKLLAPAWKLESGQFGVLTLPELITLGDQDGKKAIGYTSAVREGLTSMDKRGVCGWIIDLSQNGGGNMWPMLWGLDPLLGPSPFGKFLKNDGIDENWVRANGYIFPTSEKLQESPVSFTLKHSNAPVAVLIGPRTGSSGEMVAIAFKGRNDVRHFGSPTAGLTSANTTHKLSDGAYLVLTSAGVSDRLSREYSGPIIPDELVAFDNAKSAAKIWLKTKCRKATRDN